MADETMRLRGVARGAEKGQPLVGIVRVERLGGGGEPRAFDAVVREPFRLVARNGDEIEVSVADLAADAIHASSSSRTGEWGRMKVRPELARLAHSGLDGGVWVRATTSLVRDGDQIELLAMMGEPRFESAGDYRGSPKVAPASVRAVRLAGPPFAGWRLDRATGAGWLSVATVKRGAAIAAIAAVAVGWVVGALTALPLFFAWLGVALAITAHALPLREGMEGLWDEREPTPIRWARMASSMVLLPLAVGSVVFFFATVLQGFATLTGSGLVVDPNDDTLTVLSVIAAIAGVSGALAHALGLAHRVLGDFGEKAKRGNLLGIQLIVAALALAVGASPWLTKALLAP
jgi:hypothetical protein